MKNKKWFLFSLSIVMTVLLCVGSVWADEAKLAQNITCKEAHEMIQKNPKIVIIDVRTQPEFQFVGYIEGSYNIPYWFMGSLFTIKGKEYEFAPGIKKKAPMNRYQFTQNPDFMKYVKQITKPTDTVFVYCGSSKRSAMAADDLVKAGHGASPSQESTPTAIDGIPDDRMPQGKAVHADLMCSTGLEGHLQQ